MRGSLIEGFSAYFAWMPLRTGLNVIQTPLSIAGDSLNPGDIPAFNERLVRCKLLNGCGRAERESRARNPN
jgi:hypothetical protein